MKPEILREVSKGKGFKVARIPFADIASKNASVKIDNLEEFQAVTRSIIESIDNWEDLFEHGILNKYGYPMTYEFSRLVDEKPHRHVYVLNRPVQHGSSKTVVDDTPVSKIFIFGEGLVQEIFGSNYKLDKISILVLDENGDEQVRHIDFNAHIELNEDEEIDYSLIIPLNVRGSMCVWSYSQHIVHTSEEAKNASIEEHRRYSYVREKLENNPNFKIDIDDCEKKRVFFGTNEMLILGDNFVHAGDSNTMSVKVYKMHFYVKREGSMVPDDETRVIENLVWDLTRKGAASRDKTFAEFETYDEYDTYRNAKASAADEASAPVSAPVSTQASTAKGAKSKRVSSKADISSAADGAQRKRGRPKKATT